MSKISAPRETPRKVALSWDLGSGTSCQFRAFLTSYGLWTAWNQRTRTGRYGLQRPRYHDHEGRSDWTSAVDRAQIQCSSWLFSGGKLEISMDSAVIAAAASVSTAVIALVAAGLVVWQVTEMRRATYASAFKVVHDLLQAEELRQDRRFVMTQLRARPLATWTEAEIVRAERVCASYDSVGVMCRMRFIPIDVVADPWCDSIRTSWSVLRPLIEKYRSERGAPEFWCDYQRLAGRANELHGQRQQVA
ncbi:DUF4760 domain-containing protein [Nocardia sp. NPDC055053]